MSENTNTQKLSTLQHNLCKTLEFHDLCKTLLLIDNQHDILACMKGQYEKKNIYIYIYIHYIYTLVYTHTLLSLCLSRSVGGEGDRMQRIQE